MDIFLVVLCSLLALAVLVSKKETTSVLNLWLVSIVLSAIFYKLGFIIFSLMHFFIFTGFIIYIAFFSTIFEGFFKRKKTIVGHHKSTFLCIPLVFIILSVLFIVIDGSIEPALYEKAKESVEFSLVTLFDKYFTPYMLGLVFIFSTFVATLSLFKSENSK